MLSLLAVLAWMIFLGLTDVDSSVKHPQSLSPEALAEAKQLLQRYDPRNLAAGNAAAEIPYPLLAGALNYLARGKLDARSEVAFLDHAMEIRLSQSIPLPLLGERFVNTTLRIDETPTLPKLTDIRVANLQIPPALADWVIERLLGHFDLRPQWQTLTESLRHIEFDNEHALLRIHFVWQPEKLQQVVDLLLPPEDLARLQRTQLIFVQIMGGMPAHAPVPLTQLLPPLFLTGGGGKAQYRAALLVLGTYLTGKDLDTIIPQARDWPRAPPLRVVMHERLDTAQHFIVSAMLSAWAGERLSQAIGLFKEILDARRGSGFSFADLAADRAGTLFGKLAASGSPNLKAWLNPGLADDQLMPPPADLPEQLREADFRQRYGGPGDPAYQKMLDEIDVRIALRTIYR